MKTRFDKIELNFKNKITYLHNHLQEGNAYAVAGIEYIYKGYEASQHHETAHIFERKGRRLILDRSELSILDIFNQLKL
jgi:hypothetical protein